MMREWPYTALGRDELGCPSPLTSKFPWALGKSLRLRGCTLFIPTHLSSRQCSVQIQYDKLNHEKFCPSNLVFGTSIGYSHTSIPSIPIPVPGPAQGSMWERWRERGQSHIFQKVAFSTDISLTRVGSFPKKLRIWSEQRCEMLVTTSSSYFAPAVAPTPGFSTL